jgi:SAM-dependent methyltransferase
MGPVHGARSFEADGDDYDAFMGRYSRALAAPFADAAGVAAGQSAVDVGCGPGALTRVLVQRLGAPAVAAVDPSESFVRACAEQLPGVDVRTGRAEAIPLPDGGRDAALAQLVLHFVGDPARAASEMVRVVRPGGVVGACVWDFTEGMQMLRLYWDAALAVDPAAPDEARTLRFGRPGEIPALLEAAGLLDVEESTLTVESEYRDVEELWSGLLHGIGPAGSHCVSLPDGPREAVRLGIESRLGTPRGPFTLSATARCAVGRAPS